ncbi:tRNA pseudouridine(13) synthase TruD [Pseudoalteromonas sp. McH1-7]|uniref:tRNA pseudouridine(13) synthase TruD n=1 Tax=Pseudoalteromonas sp. McH1-7 TaxID=2745574 RepID=UPI001590671C|nr:tRNA pseudouridine(13) synthase TruD [Pseudoalteromonas sp. McH1-7]NUZ10578.1 tRNA pseudouridine(13) synthase TruD [Pseudoalteromonas sp. McH1-7]
MKTLNYLYGKPLSDGDFKSQPEDFRVEEILDIPFTGEGEHVCLQIVKKGENTAYVAKKLAEFAQLPPREVSYAGIKDRHGVCTQWFSVPVPIKKPLDFSALNSDSIFIVKQVRHNRKLKTGCHKGNRFAITLRNVTEPLDILSRINAVRQGVPNYFGEQRFGHDGHNLDMAQRLFDGEKIRDKKLRGLVLSAARSHLFNQVVSRRVAEHGLATTWHREIFLLNGSNAFFESDIDCELIERLLGNDILLSAPLVGKGEKGLLPQEREWLSSFSQWHNGLAEFGMKNERRALRLMPQEFKVSMTEQSSMVLEFSLPKGTFATAVLRELVNHRDASKK